MNWFKVAHIIAWGLLGLALSAAGVSVVDNTAEWFMICLTVLLIEFTFLGC